MQTTSRGFTLIEVIAALAVVSIALVTLVRLHLGSINITEHNEIATRAVFLAQEKMDEVLAQIFPLLGTSSGAIQQKHMEFNWQTQITELQLPQLNKDDIVPLRRVQVEVSWKRGNHHKHINLTTYVTERKLSTKK